MALSVALVTPFAWSQPHDVNEHVDGLARELRARGHRVTVLAPSNRARELAAGRRALVSGLEDAELVGLGTAVPSSRRSRMGVPVGVRANLAIALAAGGFDVVHGFEPGLPSLSYLALRDTASLTVATFLSPERLSYPPARTRRERLLGRLDALLATSEDTAEAAAERLPRRHQLVPLGGELDPDAATSKRNLVTLQWRAAGPARLRARAPARAADGLADARRESFEALADGVEAVYGSIASRRRTAAPRQPLDDRDWITADLHMHTTWSHDCSIEVDDLLDHAEADGLGAIAV